MKKVRKTKRIFKLFFVIGIFALIMWNSILKYMIPHSWTVYPNYNCFYQCMKSNFWINELPESADHVSYYFYRGNFTKKIAVAFDVNADEYDYVERYYKTLFNANDWTVTYEDVPLTDELLNNDDFSFLQEMSNQDISGYEILVGWEGGGSTPQKSMILGNPDTRRIIIFEYDKGTNL